MTSVQSYSELYRFDTPLCRRVMLHAEATAMSLGEAAVVERARKASAVVQAALDLRDDYWLDQKPTADRQEAVTLDTEVDEHLGALDTTLEAAEKNPLHPHRVAARELRRVLFPQGVQQHRQARWEDKQARTDALLATASAVEHAPVVAALFLAPVVDRLVSLDKAFDASLARGLRVTWEQLKAAEDAADAATKHFISFTVGHFEVEDLTGHRDQILSEVLEAQKRVHELRMAALAEGRRKKAAAKAAAAAAAKDNKEECANDTKAASGATAAA